MTNKSKKSPAWCKKEKGSTELPDAALAAAGALLGDQQGALRAGDRVQVILGHILVQERKLQFSIVEEGVPLTGKKPAKAAAKAKKNFNRKGKRR